MSSYDHEMNVTKLVNVLSIAYLQYLLYKNKIVKSSSFSSAEDHGQVRRKIAFYLKTTFNKVLKENPLIDTFVDSINIQYNTVSARLGVASLNYDYGFFSIFLKAMLLYEVSEINRELNCSYGLRSSNNINADSFMYWNFNDASKITIEVDTNFIGISSYGHRNNEFDMDDDDLYNSQHVAFSGLKNFEIAATRLCEISRNIYNIRVNMDRQSYIADGYNYSAHEVVAMIKSLNIENIAGGTPYTNNCRRVLTISNLFKDLRNDHGVNLRDINIVYPFACEMIYQAWRNGRYYSRLNADILNLESFDTMVNALQAAYEHAAAPYIAIEDE